LSNGTSYLIENVVGVMQDVIILEAQHHEAGSTQQGVVRELTARCWEVGGSIGFDIQASLFAEKVNDIVA
jgi:hypothetical protein